MIECRDLNKKYKRIIFDNADLEIENDKLSFLMGENGAGKTTLIKCLMKMESYNGQIEFDGNEVDEIRDECMVLFDDCPFYANLSGLKNLYIFCENKVDKEEIKHKAQKYLGHALIKEKVKTYSYGQKKKLGIILVDLLKPKYIFLDEISNGLDYETLKKLKELIKEWSKYSTILMTGHQFDFYNDLVDEVIVLKDGKMHRQQGYKKGVVKLEEVYDEKMY